MKVAVIMGNDHPMEVTTPELAEGRMKVLRAEKQAAWSQNGDARFGPRFPGSGDYWIRSFEFEVVVK